MKKNLGFGLGFIPKICVFWVTHPFLGGFGYETQTQNPF